MPGRSGRGESLKELEQAGVIHRRLLPRPTGSIIYELTSYGMELEDVVVHLGRWGAKTLGDPRREEIITVDSLIMALRSTFRPESARKTRVAYEFRFGDIVIHARIDGKKIAVAEGPMPGADPRAPYPLCRDVPDRSVAGSSDRLKFFRWACILYDIKELIARPPRIPRGTSPVHFDDLGGKSA